MYCSLLAILSAAAVASIVQAQRPLPKFPSVYEASGTIELPYAEIVEPYTAWIDLENSRGRIDAYGGLTTTLNLGKSGEHGVMREIVYETTEKFLNRRICLESPGSAKAPVAVQPIIPDLSNFTYTGRQPCGAAVCATWELEQTLGDKINRYTFRGLELGELTAPFDFHFIGYDNLFGSHYDEYRVTYKEFRSVLSIPDSVFSNNVSCDSLAERLAAADLADTASSRATDLFGHLSLFRAADHIGRAFELFKSKHRKRYSGERENAERAKTFRANYHFVDSTNRRNLTYKLRLNHMADLSPSERRSMFGLLRTKESSDPPGAKLFVPKADVSEIPTDFDWRVAGAVTPVKDQAICGSCWSFSTSGVIEGAHFLKTKELVELSQQNLMDCSWGEGNYACDGGEQWRAYKWIIEHGGLATAHSYGPYLMADGKCHYQNATVGAKITGYVRIKAYSQSDLMIALTQHPVAVNIDASHRSFSFYGHGVYYEPECGYKPENLDHSVLAVGYGTLDGQDYWLIKNSWSVHWGNDGYVLMSRQNNNCGVASDASFVEMD